MINEIFECFMKIRFPKISKSNYYYSEWKSRFETNPITYMDFESKEIFKSIMNYYIEHDGNLNYIFFK